MCEEKVTVVKVMIAKLGKLVPYGYSKSTDKITDHIKAQKNSEVNQFFSAENPDLGKRRYLDPAMITTKMKAEEEDEKAEEESKEHQDTPVAAQTSKTTDPASKAATEEESKENGQADAGEEKEKKEIQAVEKSVQIRLCNYSMLVRAS